MDPALHCVDLGLIPAEEAEVLRYAQWPQAAAIPEDLPLAECLRMAEGRVRCRAVWRQYPLTVTETGLDLGFARTASNSLSTPIASASAVNSGTSNDTFTWL